MLTPNPDWAAEARRALVLVSGGLDSSILLHYLAIENQMHVEALFFNFGQSNYVAEHPAVLRAVAAVENVELIELDIRSWRSLWNDQVRMGDVPRNATLALLAVPIAKLRRCNMIAVGSTKEDAAMPDGQPGFYDALNALLEQSKVPQRVCAFWLEAGLGKSDFSRWALEQSHLGERFIQATRSCWKPRSADEACGLCPACEARNRALGEAAQTRHE